jgi:predicted AlkP superfamily phosphohydrolase/phosphomutase
VEGLPSARDGYYPFLFGWIDLETLKETIEYQHVWFGNAVQHLLQNNNWDLFFTQIHAPDWMYHTFSTRMDPLTAADSREVAQYQAIELAVYQILDRLVARILDCAGPDTLVVLTSDHGAKPTSHDVQIGDILVQAGLTALQDVPQGPDGRPVRIKGGFKSPYAKYRVDWPHTQAFAQRPGHIYVNVKGRDPQGIVEPGADYEAVCNRVLAALCDYTDPETGLKPVALALKRRDARTIGLYGEGVGDIIYTVHPEFGHEHGHQLTTAEYGIGSLEGMFVMKGPGVKRGVALERTVWLVDIVPTICHLAELPVPPSTEGAIIYQALENPNSQLEELQTLRRNYARLESAFQSGQAEMHTY